MLPPPLLALLLALTSSPAHAATAGSFASAGSTLVSAMMMFLGNTQKVYILDKAEGNAAQINGHSAWGAVWDIATQQSTVMDIATNVFCSSGMHLPNGSYVTFGGNSAVGRGGKAGSQVGPTGIPAWDAEYQDFDGSRSIRILNPCSNSDNFKDASCQWFDDPNLLSMQKRRWYSTAEALADGSIVLIGGFVNGGYINRNYPNNDPAFEGGAAEPTYEFFPANGRAPQVMQFMITTSGLNAYAHAFLLTSGKMFVQANYSTTIWDYNGNVETPLPNMPGNVVRVYPASGAVAMLPLTPANNWNPTILFCGGSDMTDAQWGNYANPAIDTWNYPASKDCQRITPEPSDGSQPAYTADDPMPQGRTMSQFIVLPDGTMLVINGGLNGTAGYATQTGQTSSYSQMPFGMSLASGPVGTPAIYNPNAPQGQRWSTAGLGSSNIARLYHSSAMLLPDGSVLVAGSNPNVDVNLTTVFSTEYRAELFYPPYFSAKTRPAPTGAPSTLTYGGAAFDFTVPAASYSGSANAAAGNTTVVLVRGGFTTHAMNMGQRYVQLNNTFTVNKDGSYVLHVGQAPNPNVLQPGPALLFVVVQGVPSKGSMVIVGNGQIGTQQVQPQAALPASVLLDSAVGSGSGGSNNNNDNGNGSGSGSGGNSHMGIIIGGIVGAVAVIGILGAAVGICLARRKRQGPPPGGSSSTSYMMAGGGQGVAAFAGGHRGFRSSDSSAFVPLQQGNDSQMWDAGHGGPNASVASLHAVGSGGGGGVYHDRDSDGFEGYGMGGPHGMGGGSSSPGRGSTGMSMEFDPYSREPRRVGTPLR